MATLPIASPIHAGMSHNELLGYLADYLQDLAAAAPSTGELKLLYTTSLTLSGWLPCIGYSIGNLASGAVYAGAAYQALFEHIWNQTADTEHPVSYGGSPAVRGSSAESDWEEDRTITLPDFRGRALFGFDPAGSSGRLTIGNALGDGNSLGKAGGAESHTLTTAEMPSHTHAIPTEGSGPATLALVPVPGDSTPGAIETGVTGNGVSHNNIPPGIVAGIWFIKL